MTWKRVLTIAVVTWVIAAVGTVVPAQEQPGSPVEGTEDQGEQVGFWGDRFALYLEAGYGSASAEDLDSSMQSLVSQTTTTALSLDDVTSGLFAVGWKLPYDRGSFRVVFTGFSEDSYELNSKGNQRKVSGTNSLPSRPLPWWHVNVSNGTLNGAYIPPTWQDTNGDSILQDGEIFYDPENPTLTTQAPVPDNAQNRLQTWDFLFLRDFGGRVWSAAYTCGLRYLVYDGNVPATAWLSTSAISPRSGFTDGTTLRLLSFTQETTAWGPTGSLEVQGHLFRDRLVLFGQARFAFLLQDMNVDSGEFFTLVNAGGVNLFSPARLEHSLSKSTWNFGGEIGARVRILEGFKIELAYNRTSYQDTVLLPFSITIPANAQEIPFGTVALYGTQNLDLDTVRLSAGFQF